MCYSMIEKLESCNRTHSDVSSEFLWYWVLLSRYSGACCRGGLFKQRPGAVLYWTQPATAGSNTCSNTSNAQLSSSAKLVAPLGKKIVKKGEKNDRKREGGKKESKKQQGKHQAQRRRGMRYSRSQSSYSLLPVGETPPQRIFTATHGGCTHSGWICPGKPMARGEPTPENSFTVRNCIPLGIRAGTDENHCLRERSEEREGMRLSLVKGKGKVLL